jgi:hypothetical protein
MKKTIVRMTSLLIGLIIIFCSLISMVNAESPWYRQGKVCNESSISVMVLVDLKGGGWKNIWLNPGESIGFNDCNDAEGVWGTVSFGGESKTQAYKISGLTVARIYDSSVKNHIIITSLDGDGVSLFLEWKDKDWPCPSYCFNYYIDN